VRQFAYFAGMTFKNLILFFPVLALFACKKNAPSTGGQTGPQTPIGEQLYNPGDTTGGSMAYGVSITPDGNILVSGDKTLLNTSIGAMSYYPLRFTVDYKTLRKVSQAAPLSNDYGAAAQSRQSGNFIYTVVPLQNSYGNGPVNQVKIIKTDTSSGIIWQRTINNIMDVTGFTLLSNGNLLFQGNSGNDLTGSTNTLALVLMDPNGNTLFNRLYTGQYFGSSVDLIEESNDFAFVGFTERFIGYNFSPSGYLLVPALVKVDFSGNVLSSKSLNNFFLTGSWHYFPSFHLAKNASGGYLLTTVTVDTVSGAVDENFYLRFLQADGSVRDSANLWITGEPVFYANGLVQAPTGNIYVLVCLNTGSYWLPQLIEYDSKGKYINAAYLETGRFPNGLVQTKDNNLVVVQSDAAANSISIQKLDPNLKPL
jgi:hypothetical protein